MLDTIIKPTVRGKLDRMRRLLPPVSPAADPSDREAGPGLTGPDGEVDLDAVYAYPEDVVGAGRPWLRANMVESLDGASQAGDGLSAGLSSPGDKKIFGVLRGLADVVLVGASTVRAEGYRPPQPKAAYAAAREAAGRAPVPVIAIVSRSLDLDLTAPLFTEAIVPTVVLTGPDADPELLAATAKAADVIVAGPPGAGGVDPGAAVDALAARGWTRLLTEGGPHLLGQLASAGRVDELCLALSPQLSGGTSRRIIAGTDPMVPQPMELRTLLEDDGFLFARYVRRPDR
jgi:riboflavin biosynthesis pyrimidine reductase